MNASVTVRRAVLGAVALLTVAVGGCHRAERAAAPLMPVLPRIPRDAARFEIDAVDDSTATFRVFESRWLRTGLSAYAVDPVHRDALVARLTIIRRDSTTATALVTSQVARVTTGHFVLVPPPPTPWWATKRFWIGTLVGTAVGAGTTAAIR
ncbi:hypothetical protein [Gemmatimonas sp.]|jgi:hypothetical protein|uniref:hypothetical protein n=1 Tax=Gemmatimonas sp. TaxID=1962908 RepID=UPI0037C0183B